MNSKRCTAIILSIVFVLSLALPCFTMAEGEFAGGDGSKENPYLVSTKEQLDSIRNHLNSSFKLTNDIVFEEADFAQGGAFYNNGQGFLPIGDEENPFCGLILGENFAIKGLKQHITGEYAGFIGVGENCEIRYITLENAVITVDSSEAVCVGGIIAYAKTSFKGQGLGLLNSTVTIDCDNSLCFGAVGGVVENGLFKRGGGSTGCTVTINSQAISDDAKTISIGGVFGVFEGTVLEKTVNDSPLNVNINSGSGGANISVGGIAGYTNADFEDVSSMCNIIVNVNASSNGDVTVLTGGGAGGATGDAGEYRTMTGTYIRNPIEVNVNSSGDANVASYAGGIAGMLQNYMIENTESGWSEKKNVINAENAVSAQTVAASGGFVGYAQNGKFSNLENAGSVYAEAHGANSMALAGGIAAIAENSEIMHSKNIAFVDSAADGIAVTGGIAAQEMTSKGIECCYNTAEISAQSFANVACAGGIAGVAENIKNSYNTGSVIGASDYLEVGGIAGEIQNGTIDACYSYGTLYYVGNSDDVTGYIGNIAALLMGTSKVTNCYYFGLADEGIGGYEETASFEVKACTAEEMEKQSTFVGFDFENIWEMGNDAPQLRRKSEPVITPTPTATPIPTPTPSYIIGDVNGDGKVNSRDVAKLQKHLLGTELLEGEAFNRANVRSDDNINSRDVAALQKIIMNV